MVVVPKVFHHIWIGPKPLPPEHVRWIESWRLFHPDWSFKFWTEKELPEPRYPEIVNRCRWYAQQVNFHRLEVLLQHGGIYLDTDFQCLKNIEPLISGKDFISAYQTEYDIANGFIGATPGHPILSETLEVLREIFVPDIWGLGPVSLTRVLRGHPEISPLACELFYPYLWNELHRKGEEFPRAYAVHHWASRTGMAEVVRES